MTLEEREKRARALFLEMEEEVKEVRSRYMDRIKALYNGNNDGRQDKENKAWNSPVKKLKEKNR